ncbi:hypothetical protein ABGB12_25945 [Actinocorallia sp. B10E7]|uniref:hypothetical protein n=1 Tax=Actinocorallia sp. B10E7 TaxID=3153558 RepID=UPI00325D2245
MSVEPSPGTEIAEALRRSPVYADPSLEAALPAAKRRVLLARIEAAPMPVFVVLVPLVKGGTWEDPEELLTVVHDRLGRDGVYISLGSYSPQLEARQWGGTEEERRDSEYAVQVPFFLSEFDEAPLADHLIEAVELVAAGGGRAAYEKAIEHPRSEPSIELSDSAELIPTPVVAGVLGVAAVTGLAVWRWRRSARVLREQRPLLLSREILTAAGKADRAELRDRAEREVIAFGELLEGSDLDSDASRVHDLMTLALDAYQAAAKTLDSATGVPDLAGALVLVDRGRDALDSARALASGGREAPHSPLCFFNPLHGDAAGAVVWRELGSRDSLRVQACRACAKAVRDHRAPESLPDQVDGRTVPYYAVPTLWARTGYGQFGDDLVHRVLRGDLRRT